MENIRAHLKISGRVQGVCFRMYAEKESARWGVTGWVRNLPTGQVEVLIEGDKKAVEEVVRWCHKGPSAANVASVEVSWEPYHGDFTDFRSVG